jgi:hypothetical protein
MRGPRHLGPTVGWRRFVALLAVAAWMLVCPEVPEAFAAAAQPAIHGHHADRASAHHADRQDSCDPAAHASAVLQFSMAIRAGGVIGAPPSPAAAVARPILASPSGLAVAVTRAINQRPPQRRTRLGGFWPHAPPLVL